MLLRRYHSNNNVNTTAGVAKKEVAPVEPRTKEEPEFTEAKINAMNGASLRKLAKSNGVEDPENFTVKELRSILCEKLIEA